MKFDRLPEKVPDIDLFKEPGTDTCMWPPSTTPGENAFPSALPLLLPLPLPPVTAIDGEEATNLFKLASPEPGGIGLALDELVAATATEGVDVISKSISKSLSSSYPTTQ